MKKPARKLLYALIPTKLSSKLAYLLSHWRHFPFRDRVARKLIAVYDVRMEEAAEPDYTNRVIYPTLNSIFTRALRPGARPLSPEGTISSPVDGTISQINQIRDGRIIQAKQHDFSVTELLGGDEHLAEQFRNGHFTTIYLSPRDYHRVHMPISGKLTETIHIPGRLLSVAPSWIRDIPGLFAKNERLACLFETELGQVAVIMVGAIHVGSIETVWSGQITPPYGRRISRQSYAEGTVLNRGDEMGRFNMGSTVILLFGENRIRWQSDKQPEQHLSMGEAIADIVPGS